MQKAAGHGLEMLVYPFDGADSKMDFHVVVRLAPSFFRAEHGQRWNPNHVSVHNGGFSTEFLTNKDSWADHFANWGSSNLAELEQRLLAKCQMGVWIEALIKHEGAASEQTMKEMKDRGFWKVDEIRAMNFAFFKLFKSHPLVPMAQSQMEEEKSKRIGLVLSSKGSAGSA